MPTPLTQMQVKDELDRLLAGRGQPPRDDILPGAELVVTEEGVEVFSAALASHARVDQDDESIIWIRPLTPVALDPATGLPSFDLTIARRRALQIRTARLDGPRLVLDLATGQRAVVQPARGEQLATLQDFDTWMTTLPAEACRGIEALDHD